MIEFKVHKSWAWCKDVDRVVQTVMQQNEFQGGYDIVNVNEDQHGNRWVKIAQSKELYDALKRYIDEGKTKIWDRAETVRFQTENF